ncbi:MAG: 2-oxo acid dehydrogenase subunit E2 [Candidatus Margulisiibacteriota bacterium]
MKTIPFKKIKNISSMRKLALGTWRTPTDPSVNVQLDLNISELKNVFGANFNRYLKVYIVKVMSKVLDEIPEINTILIRGKFRQRTNNRLFIPTMFRHNHQVDLNGIYIDNAHLLSLDDLKKVWNEKISDLRSGNNKPTRRVIYLFKLLPSFLLKPVIQIIDFIQYTCNISLRYFGLPSDPFGSMTITFLDKFDVKYAAIPIFSFSRSAITLAIGKPYVDNVEFLLPVTCTFDHRCFDGYEGAKAYQKIKKYFKSPELILN